jgi:hypothetical protein
VAKVLGELPRDLLAAPAPVATASRRKTAPARKPAQKRGH